MKILFITGLLAALTMYPAKQEQKWGQIGHRTMGLIAETHLTEKATEEVRRVLGTQSLAEVSTWMDEVRSDNKYRHMSPWHYVTILEGNTYETSQKNPDGDILWAIDKMVTDLKNGGLSPVAEAESLKVLVHLVGDLHQPLHVGNRQDRGGNDVRVQWFGDNSNLHRVWDSGMIENKQLSFTELAGFINHATPEQIQEWQSTPVLNWAMESGALLDKVYELPDNKRLGYRYSYTHFDTVRLRLLQSGVRLAGLINEIYP
ncbi:MAG: S1/P1 nuclease [Bacteroidota bacterium]